MDDILQYRDGSIVMREDFMAMKEVQDVYNTDKRAGKSFFSAVLDYLYLVYSPNSPFAEYFTEDRKKEYVSLRGRKAEDFEGHQKVAALIAKYRKMYEVSFVERSLSVVKKDIEELHKRIAEIPYDIQIEQNIKIKIPVEQGSEETVEVPYVVKYTVDNIRRKEAALIMFKRLYDLYMELQEKAKTEKIQRETVYNTMLEESGV